MEKGVVKLAIKRLPKEFNIDEYDTANIGQHLIAGRKKLLPSSVVEQLEATEKDAADRRAENNEVEPKKSLLKELEDYVRFIVWVNRNTQMRCRLLDKVSSPVAAASVDSVSREANLEVSRVSKEHMGPWGDVQKMLAKSMAEAVRSVFTPDFLRGIEAIGNASHTTPVQHQQVSTEDRKRQCFHCGDPSHLSTGCDLVRERNARRDKFKFDPRTRFGRKKNYGNRGKNSGSGNIKDIDFVDSNETQIVKSEKADEVTISNLNAIVKAEIFLLDAVESWKAVDGTLDSGASVTVGGLQQHGIYFKELFDVEEKKRVRLPDGTLKDIVKKAFITVKARYGDGREFIMQNVLVYLVDDVEWSMFLLGFRILAAYGATPDQVLYNLIKDNEKRKE